MKYDNSEGLAAATKNIRQMVQASDKVNTLTHCRFEARALFNIDSVIVADFDEFLFCSNADSSISSLSSYIHKHVNSRNGVSFDQLTFPQVITANKTSNIRDCVVAKTKLNESLFDCYAASKYPSTLHSFKSIHVGYKCPLTGYHQACGTG